MYTNNYVPKQSFEETYIHENFTVQIPRAVFHQLLFRGDQLTAKRGRGAKKAKINSVDPSRRLDGLIPTAEDWHLRLNYMGVLKFTMHSIMQHYKKFWSIQVIWRYYLSPDSSGDHGTLYQLRNRINRRNVTKDPTKNFNACDDFLIDVIEAHVISAFTELCSDFDPNTEWMQSDAERKQRLLELSQGIVEKLFDFSYNGSRRTASGDNVQEYAIQLLSQGLFYLELSDCIREGDGERILRCWRYLLPIFFSSGRTNYANEALNMIFQHDYALSPRHAQQLLWSRCINVHGRMGRNVPGDLEMEHLNRTLKECIKGLGPNKREDAITRVSRAMGAIGPLLQKFDQDNNVPSPGGLHERRNSKKDQNLLIMELIKKGVFRHVQQRKHNKFPHPRNILHGKEKKDLTTWMEKKLKTVVAC